jgi:hypothetical protein
LEEIRRQPGCSSVASIAINRVTNDRANNNWSMCVVSAGAADANTAAMGGLLAVGKHTAMGRVMDAPRAGAGSSEPLDSSSLDIRDSTNRRESDLDGPIRDAKPDRHTHT